MNEDETTTKNIDVLAGKGQIWKALPCTYQTEGKLTEPNPLYRQRAQSGMYTYVRVQIGCTSRHIQIGRKQINTTDSQRTNGQLNQVSQQAKNKLTLQTDGEEIDSLIKYVKQVENKLAS